MTSVSIILNSLEATHQLGIRLGQHLEPGSVVLLSGGLGTGKTTLTKSICEGLGVNPEIVISPTYAIVNQYQGKWIIHHVDLYRLNATEDLDHFDDEDLVCSEGITLIEWPDLLLPFLHEILPRIALHLTRQTEHSRMLTLETDYNPFEKWLTAFKEETQ
jgi:tRNA threonylcarbamoyladenosine biosynthesis protein TsaE